MQCFLCSYSFPKFFHKTISLRTDSAFGKIDQRFAQSCYIIGNTAFTLLCRIQRICFASDYLRQSVYHTADYCFAPIGIDFDQIGVYVDLQFTAVPEYRCFRSQSIFAVFHKYSRAISEKLVLFPPDPVSANVDTLAVFQRGLYQIARLSKRSPW